MARRTPLYEIHKSLGATFREYGEWELPETFTGISSEYQAVRNQVGLMDLSFRGKIRLAGPERTQFLHGMVTQDIKGIREGFGAYALMTDPKAHILADMKVYNLGDWFLLDVEPELKNKVITTLDKYLLVEATLTDISDQYGLLSLQGPKSETLLRTLLSEPTIPTEEYQHLRSKLTGVEIIVIRTGYTGEIGFELLVPQEQIKEVWEVFMLQDSVIPVGMAVLDILRLEAGIPRYGIDIDENNLPLEVGVEKQAISYTKGCYIGQEVIARMKYRGHANRFLMGLRFQGEKVPQKKDKIRKEDKEIGWMTSAVFSPGFKSVLGMGYVHREYAQPGIFVSVETAQGSLEGEIVALPFYKK
jgi:glycine cleavage system T protein